MSANQKLRLFIALKELETMIHRKDTTQEDLRYGLGNVRIELENIRRAKANELRRHSTPKIAA